jgi:Xaa-Pro aminopeptidase
LNLVAIQAAIREEGLDGWLFFDHHRRDPLAYRILNLPDTLIATRRWYYLIPVDGDPVALVHRIEPHSLDNLPGEKRKYSRWTEQVEQLHGLLAGRKKIAMQYSPQCAVPYTSMVDAGTLELVRNTGVEVSGSANLVQLFEARWTPDQLQSHLEAGKRIDAIRVAAFDLIGQRLRSGAGTSEWEIHSFIRESFDREGMFTDHGPIVAVNANASDPHYEPSAVLHRPIVRGDFVLLDMWAKFNAPQSVYYDITWTGYCGAAPSDAMNDVFRTVSGARDAAIGFVQQSIAGGKTIQGYQVDDAARKHIEERGYGQYFIHRTGHSIGTEVHGAGANMDNFETHDDRRIVPRTCFSIEPGVYLPDFGIRSEVNMYIGEGEARVTGAIQDRIVIID